MLGYLSRVELYERMARAHCLLIPSVREGWGLVVIEANSVGTPAVGYDVPGIRDSIRHEETGLLAEPGDPSALARQALSLVRDGDRFSVLQGEAIEWASGFSWESTAACLLQLVDELVCGRLAPHYLPDASLRGRSGATETLARVSSP
jgi:glycosyltransferase involved in cell wall biosynthesis